MYALIDDHDGLHELRGAGPWLVGRHSDADISCASDPYCARRQFKLHLEGRGLVIEPLSASSPTYLCSEPLNEPAAIRPGDVITFGGSTMRLQHHTAEAREGPTASNADFDSEPARSGDRATIIGRDPGPGGIKVDEPIVSRRHAEFSATTSGMELRDLGSTNGTFVNGVRITGAVSLKEGDQVRIGQSAFVSRQAQLRPVQEKVGRTAVAARGIAVDVSTKDGMRRILHPLTIKIKESEFVCLVGGSGAGKSTLMNALAGRSAVSEGVVEIEGADINREFEAIKQFLAFVPQKEVLHERLTVRAALGFIAEFRLPTDTSAAEREEAILRAAEDVELTTRLDTEFRSLSGGQKKRACLAAEILCRPRILFLDEVTSGLDEQTDFEIMRLLNRLAANGTTVVCVTHTLVNIPKFCDRVVILGVGGHLAFNGAPDAAVAHFGVERLGDVLSLLTPTTAEKWADRYRQTAAAAEDSNVSMVVRPPLPSGNRGIFARFGQGLHQFGILVRRNIALLIADRGTLGLTIAQALIIGLFVGWALSEFGTGYQAIASRKTMITLLVMSAMWMGSSGASKDIVAEAVIFQREKDVNLSVFAYLAAKVVTASFFVTIQVAILFALVYGIAGDMPGSLGSQYLLVNLTAYLGVAVGLLISAFSASESQATAIVPLALIPQLIFIGSIVPNMPEILDKLSKLAIPTNVMNQAMLAIYVRDGGPVHDFSIKAGRDALLTAPALHSSLNLAALHYLLFIGATYVVLRHRYRSGVSR